MFDRFIDIDMNKFFFAPLAGYQGSSRIDVWETCESVGNECVNAIAV